MRFLGWRKILVVIFLVGVGLGAEIIGKNGLSVNFKDLLIWIGASYLGANALKGGLEGLRK